MKKMLRNKAFPGIKIIFLISITSMTLFAINVSAEDSIIPEWVKNNAKWWAEGSISESDYITSLEYLINQGIISITSPIVEVTAAKVALTEDDRAQSFQVVILDSDEGLYIPVLTFSKFVHYSPGMISSFPIFASDGLAGQVGVELEGLTSKDKMEYYRFIAKYVNTIAEETKPFDVSVAILAGDATQIQLWNYADCLPVDFSPFVEVDKNTYRFSDTDDSEIRDLTRFLCTQYEIVIPYN